VVPYYIISEDDVIRVSEQGDYYSMVHEKPRMIDALTFERAFKPHRYKWDATTNETVAEAYAVIFRHQHELNSKSIPT
jgi:hypothetical protein